MGLDMYLSAKKYVNRMDGWGENAQIRPEFERILVSSGLADFCDDPSVDIYGTTVSVNAAYWRKANQIHNWFVSNVQDGNDNCGEYWVSEEQLEDLRSVCNEVLANKTDISLIEDILPPTQGFFFGTDEIDDWYFQDVEYTATRLKQILELAKKERENENYVSFYYQSSW